MAVQISFSLFSLVCNSYCLAVILSNKSLRTLDFYCPFLQSLIDLVFTGIVGFSYSFLLLANVLSRYCSTLTLQNYCWFGYEGDISFIWSRNTISELKWISSRITCFKFSYKANIAGGDSFDNFRFAWGETKPQDFTMLLLFTCMVEVPYCKAPVEKQYKKRFFQHPFIWNWIELFSLILVELSYDYIFYVANVVSTWECFLNKSNNVRNVCLMFFLNFSTFASTIF